MRKPHIIVLGNEKGGTGKSTLAMHIITYLLKEGKKVASLDLDGRQGTLTNYIKNRKEYARLHHINLSQPEHISVYANPSAVPAIIKQELDSLDNLINELKEQSDYIVIDTAGSDNYLMRAGHFYADTLITPINESLIDLDVIGKVNPKTIKIESLSPYAETVWTARQKRALNRQPPLNWFVLRNRLMYIHNNNRKLLDKLIEELAKRVSFTPLAGLGERVIYKELFLKGLTILDLRDSGIDIKLGISHIAAKREIENLMEAVTK